MSEDKREKDKVLFISLVQSLAANCWIQLGKHINPVTGKLEKNLKEASFTIDLLDMLKRKERSLLPQKRIKRKKKKKRKKRAQQINKRQRET